jgi:class 3 adenylate cyclase
VPAPASRVKVRTGADNLFGPCVLRSTALATERIERRLAAILAADVAGYSRLMGADESGTGHPVRTTGDGFLVEFSGAVDAPCCATETRAGRAEVQCSRGKRARHTAMPTGSPRGLRGAVAPFLNIMLAGCCAAPVVLRMRELRCIRSLLS